MAVEKEPSHLKWEPGQAMPSDPQGGEGGVGAKRGREVQGGVVHAFFSCHQFSTNFPHDEINI